MSERIVVGESAQEFFRQLVSDTLSQRRLRVAEATEFYLVNLLAEQVKRARLPGNGVAEDFAEPLALILKKALESDRDTRWRQLKRLGDTSLFVSGFFGDSLSRSVVDVSYYISMGEQAYDTLSGEPRGPSGAHELFGELAKRFAEFVDLFAEISELSALGSNRGLVRLYERFLMTGSERVAARLRERGVALFAGPGRARYGLKQ